METLENRFKKIEKKYREKLLKYEAELNFWKSQKESYEGTDQVKSYHALLLHLNEHIGLIQEILKDIEGMENNINEF